MEEAVRLKALAHVVSLSSKSLVPRAPLGIEPGDAQLPCACSLPANTMRFFCSTIKRHVLWCNEQMKEGRWEEGAGPRAHYNVVHTQSSPSSPALSWSHAHTGV